MSLILVFFVFVGLHLLFLSLEMGWRSIRLRRNGQNTQGIIVSKVTKGLNKHFVFYEFLALDIEEGGDRLVIKQRITVTKLAFDHYSEGQLLEIRYVATNPKNNMRLEDTVDLKFCALAIFVVTVLSIPWITMPFTWAFWFKQNHYTVSLDSFITFGLALILWAVSRVICCKCYRSKAYQQRDATIQDLQRFNVEFTAAAYDHLSEQDCSGVYSAETTHKSSTTSVKIGVITKFTPTRAGARKSTSHSVQSV